MHRREAVPTPDQVRGRLSLENASGNVSLDRLRADRRVEIDQVSIRVAKQQRAVSPWLGRRPLDKVADHVLQFFIFLVDIIHAKLEDRAMVVGGASRSSAEQI